MELVLNIQTRFKKIQAESVEFNHFGLVTMIEKVRCKSWTRSRRIAWTRLESGIGSLGFLRVSAWSPEWSVDFRGILQGAKEPRLPRRMVPEACKLLQIAPNTEYLR